MRIDRRRATLGVLSGGGNPVASGGGNLMASGGGNMAGQRTLQSVGGKKVFIVKK